MKRRGPGPACEADVDHAGGAAFPLFGRFRCDTDVDQLAGPPQEPPIVLPVELSLVPDQMASFADVACGLRCAPRHFWGLTSGCMVAHCCTEVGEKMCTESTEEC